MVAVSSNQIKLNTDENYITLKELADKPLLVHCKFEKNIANLFYKMGFEPRILCSIEDTRPLLLLAEMGMGIAIVPRNWTNLIPTTNLKIIEISELPLNTGTIIAWMKNSYLSSVTRHFLETF